MFQCRYVVPIRTHSSQLNRGHPACHKTYSTSRISPTASTGSSKAVQSPLCRAHIKAVYQIQAGSSTSRDSPHGTEFMTLGSTQALQVTRVTCCSYRLGSKCLDLPGARNFRSADIPTYRGNSRSKETVELKEFKLDVFWHSEGTGMEMNRILQTVSPNFPHRHSQHRMLEQNHSTATKTILPS